MTQVRNIEDRLLAKVVKLDGGCWLWTGSVNPRDGYGRIGSGPRPAKMLLVHRVAYELWVGPIPEGHHVDHVRRLGCVNRHCVNPAHLEAVTQRENNVRMQETREYPPRQMCKRGLHDLTEPGAILAHEAARRRCKSCHALRMRARKLGMTLDEYVASGNSLQVNRYVIDSLT